uniref:Putative transmembrane lipoprotein n=1 Tax=Spiroplasma citri TaxID=2133 RepID=Q3ZVL1_SPICI|nr:lipoprotein [Spiroplasma citri]CAI94261.1 putative transmembrane lipoprotein [Spiroplasma citri]
MKKILSLIGAGILTTSAVAPLVACTPTRLATNEEIANRVAYLFTHESVNNASEKKITFEVDKLQSKDFYLKKLKELIPVKISDFYDTHLVIGGKYHVDYNNFDKTKVSFYNDENSPEDFFWVKNKVNFYVQYNEFKETNNPIQITINRKFDSKDRPDKIDLGTIISPNTKPTKDELINKIIQKSDENDFIKNWILNYDHVYNINYITETRANIYFVINPNESLSLGIHIELIYRISKIS